MLRKEFKFDPTLDFAIERFIDAPPSSFGKRSPSPSTSRSGTCPGQWGRVVRTEMDLRPGGAFSIDIAVNDGPEVPNLGCFLDVVPMERLVWTSMLFPGYRPAVFDDIPITAVMTLKPDGTGTRYVFTALHRDEEDLKKNKESGFYEGTEVAINQFAEHVLGMK